MEIEKKKTPSQLWHYASGVRLGRDMDMWKVHTDEASYRKGYWIGQIMIGMGFDDSPDCEFISGGKSTKDITGMALGRCGNIFHWGFTASPEFMTESAKQVFVNTVFYMAQFNGQKSLVKRWKSSSRKIVDDLCFKKTHALIDHKTGKCVATGDADKDELLKYYTENYSYFYFKGRGITPILDEEAKSLGVANNDIRLLEKCIEMLEEGKNSDAYSKAVVLLKRYTEKDFKTAKEWRRWFKKNKKKLFFTELGGYKFMVDSRK